MEKGNNFMIYCSTTAFEKIRRQIIRSIQENTNLETKSSFLINWPQVYKFIHEIQPWIQSWTQVNKTAIEMCHQQLENMLRKLDMEQTEVLLKKEKTKLTTVTESEEAKYDFRIEKETKKKQAQTDGKEYNMKSKKNNSKNEEGGSNNGSNQISEEKQELSDNNTCRRWAKCET